jgi:hypothetical protein
MANHYVRQGASGANNGNNWTDAWTVLPTSYTRGDTYYVADGSYGSQSFSQNVSGSLYIYIRKAIESDHGTDTGWDSSYGDGQATFTTWAFSTSYWDIDGQTGSGKTGYGFKCYSSAVPVTIIKINAGSHILLSHIEASSTVIKGGDVPSQFTVILEATTGGTELSVTNCYFHESNQWAMMGTTGWNGVTITDNYFEKAWRKELWSSRNESNLIFANNICEDVCGTGPLQYQNATNVYIYNNVFFTISSDYTNTDNIIGNWYGTGYTATNFYIYGNTFVNQLGAVTIGFDGPTNINVANNLFYGPNGADFRGTMTRDYDWCYDTSVSGKCSAVGSETHGQIGAGNPFVNIAIYNYRLSAATNAGTSLAAPYNTDIIGVARAIDGVWDRGAYEYNSGAVVAGIVKHAASTVNKAHK